MKIEINNHSSPRAFSLIEVMVAIAIFFIGTFAILGLISSGLENARRLQRPIVDAGVLASDLSTTNQLVEGTYSGNLGDLLGNDYSEYNYTETITEALTNKLFRADFVLQLRGDDRPVSEISVFLFRPLSPAGSLDGATTGR
jgi:prepilin-type N-terminal cleavage/methylation domain-containing protein